MPTPKQLPTEATTPGPELARLAGSSVGPNRTSLADPSPEYMAMKPAWDLIEALKGGTEKMREAGNKYLPQEPKEDDDQFKVRLNRSFLYEMFGDTVDALSAKPFSKPLTVHKNELLPNDLQAIMDSVDRCGTALHDFAEGLFDNAVSLGHTHIFVDYPSKPQLAEGQTRFTLRDQREMDIRPYFTEIEAPHLFYWAYEVNQMTHKRELTEIRFYEWMTVLGDDGSQQRRKFIRVVTRNEWARFYHDDKENEWVLQESGQFTLGKIPLVTFYTKRKGWMKSKPPLDALAQLNHQHWILQSDSQNAIRFASIGILVAAGFTEEEIEKKRVVIAPNSVVYSVNKDANIKYAEQSGSAVGLGREQIQDVEARAEVVGLAPLVERTNSSTAFGKAANENKSTCQAKSWVRALTNALYEAYLFAGDWIEPSIEELPEDFSIEIFDDFGLTLRGDADLDRILKLRAVGDIDRKTTLMEYKRRGVLGETTDIDAVSAAADAEMQERMRTEASILSEMEEETDDPDKPEQPDPDKAVA